jgi:UDP-GlcNAc:undecaprenyl-phosphate GlcNAc-1-phosphate transferase
MVYLVVFFSSLLLTIFFTPYLINFFTRVQVVDNPGEERRINDHTIPRMGGIIIYFMTMVMVFSFYDDLNSVRYFIVASLVMVGLGIVDDIIGVNWNKKFLFQTIAAVFLLYFLAPLFNKVLFFGITIPYPIDYFLLLLLIVGSINSINLMDGLDGLVSGFSLLVVCVTFTMGYYYGDKLLMILSISLMGSLIGFLKFNAYPARIFLGDTGSQSLGFFLVSAALLASLGVKKTILDLTFPVILLGVPIVDTLKVMVIRFVHKKNIFLPDKSHMHYILFGMKIRHKVTVFILQSFSFLYAASAIYYIKYSEPGGIIMFIIISIPFLFVNKILDIAQRKVHPSFFRDLYTKLPEVFITMFLKIFLPLLSLILLAVLVSFIPLKSNINNYVIMLSIAFIILLLMYSIMNYQRNKQFSDILVFINLIMFLMLSNYSDTIQKTFGLISFITPGQLMDLIVIPSVVFFLFFRERILQKKATFLTGIDLIILVFIILLTVSSGLLPSTQITNINSIVFHSFLMYIFYKLIITVKVKFQLALFYLSFIIPMIILAVLLIRR